MPVVFFTIGHSTRSIEEFVGLLQSVGVRFLVDVRTVPRSQRNTQFNREVLPPTLADFQIGYEHLAALDGLRGHKRDVSPTVNAFWQNQSFHNYARLCDDCTLPCWPCEVRDSALHRSGGYLLRGSKFLACKSCLASEWQLGS